MAFNNPWGQGSGQFNRWMKNNPWGEGGEYFKNALDDVGKEAGPLVSDTFNITLMDGFKNSPVYMVYSRLLENSIFQKYLVPFKVSNLKFDFVEMPLGVSRSGDTSTSDPKNISITINGNENHYMDIQDEGPPVHIEIKKPANIFIAKPLIHECIHGYLAATGKSKGWSAAEEHEYMAINLRGDILDGLTEFADENLISISSEDLNALAWAGLAYSDLYYALPENERSDIETRYSHFYSQTYWFEFGILQRDDPSKYGGNLPSRELSAIHAHVTK